MRHTARDKEALLQKVDWNIMFDFEVLDQGKENFIPERSRLAGAYFEVTTR